MKIAITMLFAIFLILKPISTPSNKCNINTIFQAMPPVIWYEQTIDGKDQPPTLTRFIHNKLNIFSSQMAKCYAYRLDPVDIYRSLGILGLFFWVYFAWAMSQYLNKPLIFAFLLTPFITIFIPDPRIMGYSYKIFASIGFWYFLKRFK